MLFPTPYLNRETTVVKKLASCTKINSIEKLHLFSFKSHKNMNTQNVDIHISIWTKKKPPHLARKINLPFFLSFFKFKVFVSLSWYASVTFIQGRAHLSKNSIFLSRVIKFEINLPMHNTSNFRIINSDKYRLDSKSVSV